MAQLYVSLQKWMSDYKMMGKVTNAEVLKNHGNTKKGQLYIPEGGREGLLEEVALEWQMHINHVNRRRAHFLSKTEPWTKAQDKK